MTRGKDRQFLLTRRQFLQFTIAAAASTLLFGSARCTRRASRGRLFPRRFDLMKHFAEAQVRAGGPDHVKAGELIYAAGDGRFCLFAHPPSEVIFPQAPIHQNGQLNFGVGIHQDAWDGTNDGVHFLVEVVDEAGRRHDVYERHVDPRQRTEDRRWFDETVDLSSFSGQQIQIVLKTEAGQSSQNDWAAWSGPWLLSWEESDSNSAHRPNVLLITIDTLRGDHVSSYGYPRQTTPELDRLTREGVLFAQAFSHSERTNPSHVSILTGSYPRSHGVVNNRTPVPAELITLPRLLQEAGYHTVGAVSAFHMGPPLHMDQGFAEFYPCEQGRRDAESTTDIVLNWLMEQRVEPFFMWVHFFDPHAPYLPPHPYGKLYPYPSPYAPYLLRMDATQLSARFVERYGDWPPAVEDVAEIITQYDGAIAYTDFHVARLLACLQGQGLADHTMVIATSDHGEGFGEHGVTFDHYGLHREMVHVPLIVRFPGRLPGGRIVEEPVGHVDLGPTLFELLQLDVPKEMQGGSLVPLVEGRRWSGREAIVSQMHDDLALAARTTDWSMILHERDNEEWPLHPIRAGTAELYHLDADPGEHANVLSSSASAVEKARDSLAQALLDWKTQIPWVSWGEAEPLDEELEEMLRRLGY